MATRRDYVAIAAVLRSERDAVRAVLIGDAQAHALRAIRNIEDALCDVFLRDNPNFRPMKFRDAAGWLVK
jgi:hypothetical protein